MQGQGYRQVSQGARPRKTIQNPSPSLSQASLPLCLLASLSLSASGDT